MKKDAILSWTLILIVLSLFLVRREKIVEWFAGSNEERISLSVLRDEFQRLPVPDGHVAINDLASFDKVVAASVNRQYRTKSDLLSVLKLYREVLPKYGWEFRKNIDENGRERRELYCKDGMSLIIDGVSESSSTSYYLGVEWTSFTHDQVYCGKR